MSSDGRTYEVVLLGGKKKAKGNQTSKSKDQYKGRMEDGRACSVTPEGGSQSNFHLWETL